jgi:hypothetical protein
MAPGDRSYWYTIPFDDLINENAKVTKVQKENDFKFEWGFDLTNFNDSNEKGGDSKFLSFLSNNNMITIDLKLFTLPLLVRCDIIDKVNFMQPPPSEADKGLDHLRVYAQQEMTTFNTLELAIVGKENVGKTVLTYRLMNCVTDAVRHLKERMETPGVHHKILKVKRGNGSDVELLIWDIVSVCINLINTFNLNI